MTNLKTPEQGGATEEQLEAAAYAVAESFGFERETVDAERALDSWKFHAEAALSASAAAHPAGEHHDAEEREAESEDHAATVTGKAIPATKPMRGYVQQFVNGYGAALYTLEEAVDRITALIDPAEGWSSEDADEARAEAKTRWGPRPGDVEPFHTWTKGCVNGFMLGAEWQKARMPALAASVEVDEAKLADLIAAKLADEITAVLPLPSTHLSMRTNDMHRSLARTVAEWLRGEGR